MAQNNDAKEFCVGIMLAFVISGAIVGGITFSNGCDPSLPATCVTFKPYVGNVTAVTPLALGDDNYYAQCVLQLPRTTCTIPGPAAGTPQDTIAVAADMGYGVGMHRAVLYNTDNGICTEENRASYTHLGIAFLTLMSISAVALFVFCLCQCFVCSMNEELAGVCCGVKCETSPHWCGVCCGLQCESYSRV
jgi:hypothetical protein